MGQSLGILVTSDKHLKHLIGITTSCFKKKIEVSIFLTYRGVLLTQDPDFSRLKGLADIKLCEVNFKAFGLKRPHPMLKDEDYTSQAHNGMMIEDVDRYIVL